MTESTTDETPPPLATEAGGESGPHSVPLTAEERLGAGATVPAKPAGPKRDHVKSVVEWTVLIVVAVLIAVVVRTFVFQVFYIPSGSMLPTLEINDRVLVNKLSYEIGDPERGDIVVFEAPKAAQTGDIKDLVKRVMGLPGETIEGHDGQIYVDGKPVEEPYLPAGTRSKDFAAVHVPQNSYFMLGDNRLQSRDSTVFGAVDRDAFVGKMFLVIWPLDRISIPGWLLALGAAACVLVVVGWVLLGRRRDVT